MLRGPQYPMTLLHFLRCRRNPLPMEIDIQPVSYVMENSGGGRKKSHNNTDIAGI